MKKISSIKKRRLLRILKSRAKRKSIIAAKINFRRLAKNKFIEIFAPEKFILYGKQDEREEFQEFLHATEEKLNSGFKIKINFNKTKKLFPCGMLLFIGKINYWSNNYKEKISINYPKLDTVEQMFQSVGIFDRLSKKSRLKEINHSDVIRWYYFSGDSVNTSSMNQYFDELRSIFGKITQVGLTSCINEALSNVIDHAYQKNSAEKRWWMFSSINQEEGNMLIAIYDYGDSIPVTMLKKPTVMDQIRRIGLHRSKNIDKKIFEEVSKGKSSTKLYYRGKGIPEMIEFADSNEKNVLAIYSRYGFFAKKYKMINKEIGVISKKVPGTLVIWGLTFKE